MSQSLVFICMTGNCAPLELKPLEVDAETWDTGYSFMGETIHMTEGG